MSEGQQGYIWNSLFDTLLAIDNKGALRPNAAQTWQYSDAGRTLTLKLREGMEFSTGAPVNAAAVKASLDRTRETPGQQQGKLASIESIEGPADLTVVLRLRTPDASLLSSLAQAAGVIGDPATLDQKRTTLNPVGSGPYVLDKSTVNGSTYVLKKRSDYWNAKAYPFQTLRIRVLADPTASLNALQTHEVDAATVPAQQAGKVKAAGFQIKRVNATAIGNLVLADREGKLLKPLAEPKVRQAINMAFDREKIVKQILQGAGQPSAQLFNPKGDAYDAGLEQTYPYDPAEAKRLMAEAGYPNGFSVTMPSLAFAKPFEPTISQSLADIGIKVKWEPVPPQNTISAVTSKQYPMFFFIDGLNTTARAASDNFSELGFLNPFGSKDAQLTQLMGEAGSESDPARAAARFKAVNAFAVENAWDAPIFYVGTTWATKKGVTYLGDGSNTVNSVRVFGLSG
ncbi:ABC transporter substrate-binding protein [Streptomyces sp. NPDC006872]|uniref:ABC transporter substrate-binding protein n=1 Tax=Streptomyces sp. NPDC006872 TaxID=3155720 RepID=UPI0033D03CAD